MFDIKKLGDEGKFSIMAIKKKFGPPTKIEKFNSKEGAKIVAYQQLHYPHSAFSSREIAIRRRRSPRPRDCGPAKASSKTPRRR